MDLPLTELIKSVQSVSDIYAARFGIRRDRDWYLLKIAEELGEVHKAFLRIQGQARPSDAANANPERALADEAADLLATVLLFIGNENIAIGEALERKWFCHIREPARPEATATP
jgi:NTP pyrophosphatase (non-canonical NTP hydrolase)